MNVNYLAFGMQNLSRDKGFGMSGRKGNSGDYRYGFNGMENDHEIKGDGNHLDFGARGYDPRLGRWHTPDAHESNYPSHSPYHFAYNNPNMFVDPDGNDNVIYLVALPKSESKFTKEDVQAIADKANESFEAMGLKTTVIVRDAEGFDANNLDATDSYALLGSGRPSFDSDDNFVQSELLSKVESMDETCNWQGGSSAIGKGLDKGDFDVSANLNYGGGARGILINTDITGQLTGDIKAESDIETAAFLIIHGAGHNAGINHTGERPFPDQNGVYPSGDNSKVMTDGSGTTTQVKQNSESNDSNGDGKVDVKDFKNAKSNQLYKKIMETRFGTRAATDNYDKNKTGN